MSTPVIDRPAVHFMLCAWISPDNSGNWQTGQHFVAAIDITTGASSQASRCSAWRTAFDPGQRLARAHVRRVSNANSGAALALVNGAVIVCFGTIQETAKSARGWVIAVDIVKWAIAATWCSTARAAAAASGCRAAAPRSRATARSGSSPATATLTAKSTLVRASSACDTRRLGQCKGLAQSDGLVDALDRSTGAPAEIPRAKAGPRRGNSQADKPPEALEFPAWCRTLRAWASPPTWTRAMG